ncbi:MAG TPA: nitroreductase family protein [Hyphomicrobiaceae bacterium]|jgi:nitroreductase/FMN reductase [NAD(P)H]|nr:nitroreductase family protein [Hyphomicrobiaceae bacterium]
MDDVKARLSAALEQRFGTPVVPPGDLDGPQPWPQTWQDLASRGSCRSFTDRKVTPELIEILCALALASPSKSDLQQRDIIIVEDRQIRQAIDRLLATGGLAQTWIPGAPALLVFCGNNRRQRQLNAWRGQPFVNDHLDVFFNAALDAGIALATFVIAAEAAGLGCAPISAIRNHAQAVSDLLGLPEHVFPVAGLGLGWPSRDARISLRLPLAHTVHRDRFDDTGIQEAVDAYDHRRHAAQPIRAQRSLERFGKAEFYGWSEDKVRQYATPERADWGAFVRARGFRLD